MEMMLGMPQPLILDSSDLDDLSGLPVVPVSEGSRILDPLLRLCYPTPDPVLTDAGIIEAVFESLEKYEMEDAKERLKKTILSCASGQCLPDQMARVYAIACRLQMEDVARDAAVASCRWRTVNYVPEMDRISSGALFRFLEYRREHHQGSHPTTLQQTPDISQSSPDGGGLSSAQSFPPYILNSPSADVILHTSDGVDFRVIKAILCLASPVFADMLHLKSRDSDLHPDDLPIVNVSEDSGTIANLLQVCYPVEDPDIIDVDSAQALLDSALKYEIIIAIRFAKAKWKEALTSDPFRAYFIARSKGWVDEARAAARKAAILASDYWLPEMEEISANAYRELLDYRWTCQQIVYSRVHLDDARRHMSDAPRHWSCLTYGDPKQRECNIIRLLLSINRRLPDAVAGTDADVLVATLMWKMICDGAGRHSVEHSIWDAEGLLKDLQDAVQQVCPFLRNTRTRLISSHRSQFVVVKLLSQSLH